MNSPIDKLDFAKLRPISLADKPRVDSYMLQNKARGCETSFATIYAWDAVFGFQLLDLGDRFALYNPRFRTMSYPLGAHTPPAQLREILLQFKAASLIAEGSDFVYSVPPNYVEMFPEAAEVFDMQTNLGDADYIYYVDKLIANSGAKLRKKRNHIKRFTLACPNMRIEEFSKKNLGETKEFMLAQSRTQNLLDEMKAIERAFDNFDALGLCGILMRCPCDRIAAAAIISPLAENVYDVHFEKSTRNVEGTAQMIVWQEAVAIKNMGGEFMNREQDMNEENLRKAKESLDPLEKFQRLRAHLV